MQGTDADCDMESARLINEPSSREYYMHSWVLVPSEPTRPFPAPPKSSPAPEAASAPGPWSGLPVPCPAGRG